MDFFPNLKYQNKRSIEVFYLFIKNKTILHIAFQTKQKGKASKKIKVNWFRIQKLSKSYKK
jgi:hypothetical protein